LNDAKNKAQSAFKIDGLDDAMKTFMAPHKNFLEKFDISLGGALSDSGFQAVQQIIENTLTPLEKYNQQVAYLNYLHENAGLPLENFNRGLLQAQTDLSEATSKGNEFATAIGNITAEFGDKFFDTLTSGFQGAKVSMADFVSSALMDLSKLIFKLTVTIPLANGLTRALGGGASGAAASAGSSLMGSLLKSVPKLLGFADGGITPANQPFLVGERGPELMMTPRPMQVVPNHQLGGGGQSVSVTNVFQISTGVQQTVRAEILAMMPQIEKKTSAAVKTAITRGGPMTAAVGRKS
jgi:hypothetical protein